MKRVGHSSSSSNSSFPFLLLQEEEEGEEEEEEVEDEEDEEEVEEENEEDEKQVVLPKVASRSESLYSMNSIVFCEKFEDEKMKRKDEEGISRQTNKIAIISQSVLATLRWPMVLSLLLLPHALLRITKFLSRSSTAIKYENAEKVGEEFSRRVQKEGEM
ncbi:hypothetical protein M0802_000958 [Mischocyttarus mexicanus]|nr:hypothetical protein M0802_000958 [Mischocyttarus mexicanus]